MQKRLLSITSIVLILAVLLTGAVIAQDDDRYVSVDRSFSFDIPAGWLVRGEAIDVVTLYDDDDNQIRVSSPQGIFEPNVIDAIYLASITAEELVENVSNINFTSYELTDISIADYEGVSFTMDQSSYGEIFIIFLNDEDGVISAQVQSNDGVMTPELQDTLVAILETFEYAPLAEGEITNDFNILYISRDRTLSFNYSYMWFLETDDEGLTLTDANQNQIRLITPILLRSLGLTATTARGMAEELATLNGIEYEITDITIGDYDGVSFTIDTDTNPLFLILLDAEDGVLGGQVRPNSDEPITQELQNILIAIMETIEYVPADGEVETTSGEFYESEDGTFSFNYPSEWTLEIDEDEGSVVLEDENRNEIRLITPIALQSLGLSATTARGMAEEIATLNETEYELTDVTIGDYDGVSFIIDPESSPLFLILLDVEDGVMGGQVRADFGEPITEELQNVLIAIMETIEYVPADTIEDDTSTSDADPRLDGVYSSPNGSLSFMFPSTWDLTNINGLTSIQSDIAENRIVIIPPTELETFELDTSLSAEELLLQIMENGEIEAEIEQVSYSLYDGVQIHVLTENNEIYVVALDTESGVLITQLGDAGFLDPEEVEIYFAILETIEYTLPDAEDDEPTPTEVEPTLDAEDDETTSTEFDPPLDADFVSESGNVTFSYPSEWSTSETEGRLSLQTDEYTIMTFAPPDFLAFVVIDPDVGAEIALQTVIESSLIDEDSVEITEVTFGLYDGFQAYRLDRGEEAYLVALDTDAGVFLAFLGGNDILDPTEIEIFFAILNTLEVIATDN